MTTVKYNQTNIIINPDLWWSWSSSECEFVTEIFIAKQQRYFAKQRYFPWSNQTNKQTNKQKTHLARFSKNIAIFIPGSIIQKTRKKQTEKLSQNYYFRKTKNYEINFGKWKGKNSIFHFPFRCFLNKKSSLLAKTKNSSTKREWKPSIIIMNEKRESNRIREKNEKKWLIKS